ncbi:MAG TPA: hypothetical protein PKC43_13200 [Phycisphaerales bacterium]|nr:hypothetical protein [Phycisphaerales bacterium]HMP38389.1 hypothetical protein [Phycisphaerales bacterium]
MSFPELPPDFPPPRRLSADDERVLDQLAEHGFDAARLEALAPADRARGRRLVAMLSLLDDTPVADGDETLVDATLARIARHEASQRDRLRIVPSSGAEAGGWRVRWADLITLAAVVALGVGTLAPIASRVQDASRRTACASNLAMLGGAFSAYANDNNGSLPVQSVAKGGWEGSRNAQNLELLLKGYCEHGCLNCPGHAGQGPAYAFVLVRCRQTSLFDHRPDRALLADANPLAESALGGIEITEVDVPSRNHVNRGQHVLFGNLEVRWIERPSIRGADGRADNIWTFLDERGNETIRTGALPKNPDDNFLCQ